MKVTLESNYKDFYTLSDLERAKRVIAIEKDDYETAKEWAEYAVNEALRDTGECCSKVLEATAETTHNRRVWDVYEEGTGSIDVWIRAIAKTSEGFIEVGAYLSDIWQSGAVPYRFYMSIDRYTRKGSI